MAEQRKVFGKTVSLLDTLANSDVVGLYSRGRKEHIGSRFTDFVSNVVREIIGNIITVAGAARIKGFSILDGTQSAYTVTLADGEKDGDSVYFGMINASNVVTVQVANHQSGTSSNFTFNWVGDALGLQWDADNGYWTNTLVSGAQQGTEILNFNDESDWTLSDSTSGGNSAKEDSTTAKTEDGASVKFTIDTDVGSNDVARLYQYNAFDFDGTPSQNIAWWIYAETQENTNSNRFQVRITSSGSSFAAYMWKNDAIHVSYPGWNLVEFHSSEFTGVGGETWTANTKSLMFEIAGFETRQQIYHIDQMIIGHKGKARVIFTLDDGVDTQYSIAWAHASYGARDKGIPLTLYIVPSLLDTANYMTSAQVTEMWEAGCVVCLHDDTRWDNIGSAPDGVRDRINGLKNAYAAWPGALDHASLPEGKYGQDAGADDPFDVFDGIQAAGIKTARSTVKALQPVSSYGLPHQLCINGINLNSGTTLADAKAYIDLAITRGQTCIFYGHDFGSGATGGRWDQEDLEELYDYAVTKQTAEEIEITTIPAFYDEVQSIKM